MSVFGLFIGFVLAIGLGVFWIWLMGTLIKAATGNSKWFGVLMVIPVVSFITLIVFGLQSHSDLLEEESEPAERKKTA